MRPEKKKQFSRAAAVLGTGALVATAVMIFTGFITSGPSWLVTVVGTLVAFCAIGAVMCLFLILFE